MSAPAPVLLSISLSLSSGSQLLAPDFLCQAVPLCWRWRDCADAICRLAWRSRPSAGSGNRSVFAGIWDCTQKLYTSLAANVLLGADMASRSESEFIGQLYDAALGRVPWPEVGRSLSRILDGCSASLFTGDPVRGTTEVLALDRVTDRFFQRYHSEFLHHDLWAQGALRQAVYGKAVRGSEVVPDRVLERSTFYNEFLKLESDIFHLAGSMLKLEDGRVLVVGCHHSRKSGAFSDDGIALLDRLLPHLRRATEVHHRLGRAHGNERALDIVDSGVVQFDATGRVLHANLYAERILRARDGLSRVGSRIRAAHPEDDATLRRLVSLAATLTEGRWASGSTSGHLTIRRPSGRRAYRGLVTPLGTDRVWLKPSGPAALLCLEEVGIDEPFDADFLRERYGLSPAEVRTVLGIVHGETLKQIAARANVSLNTVRTFLARAMTKTSTNSQIGLVRLVLSEAHASHVGMRDENRRT
jgi:DNA-binding CsgD family transcriptional regulator